MTTLAALAALGGPPVDFLPERLLWVAYDAAPEMAAVTDPDTKAVLGFLPVIPDGALTDPMLDRMRDICATSDAHTCEAEDCSSAIGWVGAEKAAEWHPVTLIQSGPLAIAICATCGPGALYKRLWQND